MYYRIVLQVKYPECCEYIEIIKKARSYKEAGLIARQAAMRYQKIANESGGWVSINCVEENR